MQKAHRVRLNPTPEQAQAFMRAAGVARFAYNWALVEYKRLKDEGKTADWNQIKRKFRALIDAEFPFVREVTKCAAEEAVADLRRAIGIYYKAKPKNKKLRFPRLRKRSRRIGGFGIANDKFSVEGHEARLPKIGIVNMAEPLRFAGRILSGRVGERTGHWYLTVTVDVALGAQAAPEGVVGVDFGRARFVTLSTGEVVETQAHLRKSEAKLKRVQRGLCRKQNGSSNRRKWKRRVARYHERVKSQRGDFLHKLTTDLVGRFGSICVEELSLVGLCRTRLAKSFYDAGIGEASRQLEYKLKWRGGVLQKVGRFFPSSKRCHVCGWIRGELTLGDRTWVCGGCGTRHDRDENAAINIEMEGLALLAGSGYVGVTPVEFLTTAPAAGNGCKPGTGKQERTGVAHCCAPER